MVLKATGISGGGETPNANAHVNALTRSIQPQRGKIDFPKLTDLDTRLADMDRDGIDVQVISPYPGHFVYAAPPEVAASGVSDEVDFCSDATASLRSLT